MIFCTYRICIVSIDFFYTNGCMRMTVVWETAISPSAIIAARRGMSRTNRLIAVSPFNANVTSTNTSAAT
jgi:hypothetical protein